MSLEDAPSDAPHFADFPVFVLPLKKLAPVDLTSDPGARRYRTRLREGAAGAPNFAGHYTIVGWGCGTSCIQWAIVDAIDGKVFFSRDTGVVSAVHVGAEKSTQSRDLYTELTALRFRRDSSLLVVLGAPNEEEEREGIAFYHWTKHGLKRLSLIRYADICSAAAPHQE